MGIVSLSPRIVVRFLQRLIGRVSRNSLKTGVKGLIMLVLASGMSEILLTGGATAQAADLSETSQKFLDLMANIASILSVMLAPLVGLIGGLMDNAFIMGFSTVGTSIPTQVGGTEIFLNAFWIISRDIVNYGFVLTMVLVAFLSTITAYDQERFPLRTILPKLIIAIVAVNFTFTGAKLVLDASGVATRVVYSLPQAFLNGPMENALDTACNEIPLIGNTTRDGIGFQNFDGAPAAADEVARPDCIFYVTAFNIRDIPQGAATAAPDWEPVGGGSFILRTSFFELTMTRVTPDNLDQLGPTNIIGVYTYSILKAHALPLENGTSTTSTETLLQTVASIIMIVLIAIALAAIFLVLLERLLVVWVNIIASPVIVLIYVLKDILPGADGFIQESRLLGIGVFFKYAFLPALLGIPLVVGFILITVGQQVVVPDVNQVLEGNLVVEMSKLIGGVRTLHQLFWYAISLAIIWKSVELAQAQTSIVSGGIGYITGSLQNTGGLLREAATVTPFIPAPGGGNAAIGQLSPNNFLRRYNNSQRDSQVRAGGGRYENRYGSGTRSNIDRRLEQGRDRFFERGSQELQNKLEEINRLSTNDRPRAIRDLIRRFENAGGRDVNEENVEAALGYLIERSGSTLRASNLLRGLNTEVVLNMNASRGASELRPGRSESRRNGGSSVPLRIQIDDEHREIFNVRTLELPRYADGRINTPGAVTEITRAIGDKGYNSEKVRRAISLRIDDERDTDAIMDALDSEFES